MSHGDLAAERDSHWPSWPHHQPTADDRILGPHEYGGSLILQTDVGYLGGVEMKSVTEWEVDPVRGTPEALEARNTIRSDWQIQRPPYR